MPQLCGYTANSSSSNTTLHPHTHPYDFQQLKMAWFHVSEPSSYLAITGLGIDKVIVRKKALVLPFQRVCKFSITPFDFSLSLQAMTVEKLNFSLPAVFTIGPDDTEPALIKYAVLLTGDGDARSAKQQEHHWRLRQS